jgi:hemolysin activation/secretion protein
MEQARRDSATEKRSKQYDASVRRKAWRSATQNCDGRATVWRRISTQRRNHRRTETRCAKPRHNSAVQQHDEPATEKRGAEARRNSATQQCDGKAAQQRGMRSTSGL